MKILFQGDSITDAFRKRDEINPAYQLGNGYAFLVAAGLACREPGRGWDFVNRGVSGNKLADMAARWEFDTIDVRADIFSLLAGVNDTIHHFQCGGSLTDTETFIDSYSTLLNRVQAVRPDTKIILLEPFLLEVGDVTSVWKEHLKPRQEGIAEIASRRNLPLVPLQRLFDDAQESAPSALWAYDGIHPTHAGCQLIADAWLRTAHAAGYLAA